MTSPPPRRARLVLVTPKGELLGALPPVPVSTPWWQDIGPVVSAVRETHGVSVTVLRLLSASQSKPPGGDVTYLAEMPDHIAAQPWNGVLDDHPLRLDYAHHGGPAKDLAWAAGVMARHGLRGTAAPIQVRTWNLSSLWRIPVEGQTLWLKVVPPFFAHEGRMLEALAGGPVPALLAHDGCRILMPELPGTDLYLAEPSYYPRMLDLLIGLQRDWIGRIDELLRLGVTDFRGPALGKAITSVFVRNQAQLSADECAILQTFVRDLPRRFAAIAVCGIPDTLVHGDFHPGNLRGDDKTLTLLDWGDCRVGHPLLDQPAFLERLPPESLDAMRVRWNELWMTVAPGSDPATASRLLAPIAAARRAVTYQGFLDQIEPSEHPYHRDDPREQLARTAVLLRAETHG